MKNIQASVRKLSITKLRSRQVGLLAVGLIIVMLLAACGTATPSNQSTNTPAASPRNAASPTPSPRSATTPTASQGNASNQSDFAEFGLSEAEVARRVDAVESSISTCMRDAGFEYVPVDHTTVRKAMNSNSKPSGLTADQFRTQFGYGITTHHVSTNTQAVMGEGEQNVRIRNALSTADRIAYLHTLYGNNPSATFVVSLDAEDFSQTGGCTRHAVEQVFSPKELGPGFVNLQNAQGARIDQDPRVIAANKEWAACVRKAGYSYNNSDEIKTDLANRLDAITGGAASDTLPADAQAALKQLQGEELAIAAADHQCSVKFVDPIRKQVETELLGPAANQ
ncbi:MAG: hypothetical protein GXP37_03680 [Chloroflexi bacterium]|nr:hypothetical protein [Chloroflexota bacterium]